MLTSLEGTLLSNSTYSNGENTALLKKLVDQFLETNRRDDASVSVDEDSKRISGMASLQESENMNESGLKKSILTEEGETIRNKASIDINNSVEGSANERIGKDSPIQDSVISESPEQRSTDPYKAISSNKRHSKTSRGNNPRKERKTSSSQELGLNTPSFKTVTSKKRVSGKFIERCWESLSSTDMKSFERILNISLNRTVERFGSYSDPKITKKMQKAQNTLIHNWTNKAHNSSFMKRLAVTKVPQPSSLKSLSKGINNNLDMFNYDQLLRQSQFLQTYLLAEYKQLAELERYHNELQNIYDSDLRYFEEFKKTTSINSERMSKETSQRLQKYGLDMLKNHEVPISIDDKIHTDFDPNKDEDVRKIFERIHSNTKDMAIRSKLLRMLDLNFDELLSALEK